MNRPTKRLKITDKVGMAALTRAPEDCLHRVNINLLHCPNCIINKQTNCQSECSTLGVYHSQYIGIVCNDCQDEWFLCMECGPKQRARMQTMKQLNDHTSNHHAHQKCQSISNDRSGTEEQISEPTSPNVNEETKMDTIGDDSVDDIDMANVDSDDDSISWIPVVNATNLGFVDKKNATFFEQQYIGASNSGGMNYLVIRSARRTDLQAREYATQTLPADHAELQMRIANLAFELTRSQNGKFVRALAGAFRVGCEDGFASSQQRFKEKVEQLLSQSNKKNEALESLKTICVDMEEFTHDLIDRTGYANSTQIPKTWNDIRKVYLEGARSIVTNLPIPTILKDVPGHSYVSITECIRHFLAHKGLSELALIPKELGDHTYTYDEVDHPSISDRARNILSQTGQPVSSYIMFWSDDVEPNRIKSNRGSVWLLTATIATHRENAHSLGNTFPIAVGKKGADHHPIIAKVEEEMKLLRTGNAPPFYIGTERKKVSMAFETFCTLQDQPERRDFNSVRAGNGATTGRFGVSADHNALYIRNVLPACKTCLEKMEKALEDRNYKWPMDPCNACVRWDVLDDPNGIAFWVAPKDYPETDRVVNRSPNAQEDVARCLLPSKMTYDSLKEAVDRAHDGYVNHGWSNQNCETYLEVEGLSTKYINIVMEHCARSLSLKIAKSEPDKYPDIINAAAEKPERYSRAPDPTPWTRPTVSLELHPDVMMHLVFLGVIKKSVSQIQDCLSSQSKLASFLKSTETYLKAFQTMSIDWIAIQPYQAGKMGGWVSENFLGFSRILPWFFQNIEEAVEMATSFEPPENLPPNKWLQRHNKYWLQIRGLNTKGTRDELRERVATYMENGAPEPRPAPEIPPASVKAVLMALMELLECLMSPTVTPTLINRTRYAVRVFLSKYDSLCRPLGQKIPPVLSSYNFICLLNLPDVMQRFGPLRGIYEGGPRGEGFVRFAKPLMTQGLRTNWHAQLLTKMHRAIGFLNVLPSQHDAKTKDVKDDDALRAHKGSFHLYKSAFALEQDFLPKRTVDQRNPVSVLLVETTTAVKIYSVVRDYDHTVEIELKQMESIEHFGFHYYSFGVCENQGTGIEWKSIAKAVTRIDFGLLLPLLQSSDENSRFALISSNWKHLSPRATLTDLLR